MFVKEREKAPSSWEETQKQIAMRTVCLEAFIPKNDQDSDHSKSN